MHLPLFLFVAITAALFAIGLNTEPQHVTNQPEYVIKLPPNCTLVNTDSVGTAGFFAYTYRDNTTGESKTVITDITLTYHHSDKAIIIKETE